MTKEKLAMSSSSPSLSRNCSNARFGARGSNLTTSLNRSAKGLFGAHRAEWPLISRRGNRESFCSVQYVVATRHAPQCCQIICGMIDWPENCQDPIALFGGTFTYVFNLF